MVELKDVSKTFSGRKVVDGLTLSLPKGVCYGLLGPNGAGKSTTISMMTGIIRPDSGEILMGGTKVEGQSGSSRKIFGYVPQDLALYEDLSAIDNLRFFGALYDLEGSLLDRRIKKVVDIAQLGDRLGGAVRLYSGGMKRRLNIAVSLLHDPELIILDEPTVGVDPQSRNLIFEALEELTAEGKTILYTTHYMEEIERLCSRVAIMDHGKIIANDSIEGVMRLMPSSKSLQIEFSRTPKREAVGALGLDTLWTEGSRVVKVRQLDSDQPLLNLLEQCENALGPILSVNTDEPSLEQLFLFLTGRQLRD